MLDKLKDKDIEPFTLICLYIRTLTEEEREAHHIRSSDYDNMRFDSKAFNSLANQGLIDWDIVRMRASITEKGKELALTLITEIDERVD